MEQLLERNDVVFNPDMDCVYDHQKSKDLLKGVRDLFQRELKLVVPEWISKKSESEDGGAIGVIDVFYIEKDKDPIYVDCKMFDDVVRIQELFEERLNDLLDNLDALYDNNSDLDENSKENIDSYSKAIDKCVKVYKKQCKRREKEFSEMTEVAELQEGLQKLFTEIISDYIIKVLFDALYERINNNGGQAYQMVVVELNRFLAENGVYTKQVFVGEKIDADFMEATPDSAENVTDDFNKFEVIEEIRRYPYMFGDDMKIIDGCVRIWRRKD